MRFIVSIVELCKNYLPIVMIKLSHSIPRRQ